MLIGDLFERDVTRPIPPVVYFHEQDPAALKREVEEYIITGGYPRGDSRATDEGIHEQFVNLCTEMRAELDTPGGPALPASWISGFYGSGKSSFAKLLGLALDGRKLPDGKTLAQALLAQDHSPAAAELRLAWEKLTLGMQPIAVVFDVGSKARPNDKHIYTIAVRQVQHKLGYSATSDLVADYELKLELEGLYDAFMDKIRAIHGKPWTELKDRQLAEDYFSAAMHALEPELYTGPMAWLDSRSGSVHAGHRSVDEAVKAIEQMVAQRCPGRTLFLVVDEVSQFVHDDEDRMLTLQSFVNALGERMRGKAWLLATGQQKLEEGTSSSSITKLKDRFPPALRVHLGIANIRDVVHKRLLRKKKVVEEDLRALFQAHRTELALCAYRGEEISETDFVEIYPMLPGQVGLLLDITSGLRACSTRMQGDSYAIRGLLQLLGDLFRERDLARYEVGWLVTLDRIYDILHSALDSDVQITLVRAIELCASRQSELMTRVVKAVAMLMYVQGPLKISAELVARCLYERLGQGNRLPEVQQALDALVGESLLSYSEKTGYKIESSAGQEWQRERDGYGPGHEQLSAKVQEALSWLMGDVDRPMLESLPIPWLAFYSDQVGTQNGRVKYDPKHTVVTVDFQFTKGQSRDHWVPTSDSPTYRDRIIWVAGDLDAAAEAARKVVRSERMVERYGNHQLSDDKARLLSDERNRLDAGRKELSEAVKSSFMAGQLYFRGRETAPRDLGASFSTALTAFGTRIVGELYPHPTTFSVSDKDVLYLIEQSELGAPPPVLCQERLGILALDAGRYEVTCNGRVPTDVLAYVKEFAGVTGSTLLAHFGGPPHGTPPDVLRATVVGLLRGGRVRIELDGSGELTSVKDEGARELLKDSGLRKAKLFENVKVVLTARDRNAICTLFKEKLSVDVARDDDAIADAVMARFPAVRERLTDVQRRFARLPSGTAYPEALDKLDKALEACRRSRQVEPTLTALKRSLPALRDGLDLLRRMESDLTPEATERLRQAEAVRAHYWPALEAASPSEQAEKAAAEIEARLASGRPWEDSTELEAYVALVKEHYRLRRRSLLDEHALQVDAAIDRLKRRQGFERLGPDDRHKVIRHLREGAAAGTDENAIAPPLGSLESLLASRREACEQKALAELDGLLEKLGESPTVEVALELRGREIKSEAELGRLLEEIKGRILQELAASHRVRLK